MKVLNNIFYYHTLEEYKKKYGKMSNSLKKISFKEYQKLIKENKNNSNYKTLKRKKWWLIDDTCYEVPHILSWRWFKNLKIGYHIAAGVLVVGILGVTTYHAVRMLLPSYSVNLDNDSAITHLEIIGEKSAKRGEDYKVKFNIQYMYELNRNNIHVYIDGRERDCWTFRYQTNVKNELIVDKKYVHGDITIKATANYKTTTPYLYGIENDEYVEKNLDVVVKTGDEEKVVVKEPIPQLSGALAYPVHEDDCVHIIFTIKKSSLNDVINEKLWFRTNARYGLEKSDSPDDYDFEKIVSEDKTKVEFLIPHFIIRDCCEVKVRS